MVEERSREIHDTLRTLARSHGTATVHRETSQGGLCDICRAEIRAGETRHIVTISFARVRLDDVCLVIWNRERDRFAAEPGP
jgi:hypothetical protein